MEFEFMTAGTPLPPCMPLPPVLLRLPASSTAKVMYARMLEEALAYGIEDENGILYIHFPIKELAAALSRSTMTIKRAMSELDDMGLVMRVREDFSKPNRIYLLIPKADRTKTVKSRKNRIFDAGNASDEECIAGAFSIEKSLFSPSQEPEKTPEKHPYCVTEAQKGACMRTGLTKQEKTTDIWFDEKDPLIYIRTHNTDLKNRLTAYAAAHTGECRQTDADQDTGCMEFEIRKGRFSFRLTAPYSEERRRAASVAAKKCGVHRKDTGR